MSKSANNASLLALQVVACLGAQPVLFLQLVDSPTPLVSDADTLAKRRAIELDYAYSPSGHSLIIVDRRAHVAQVAAFRLLLAVLLLVFLVAGALAVRFDLRRLLQEPLLDMVQELAAFVELPEHLRRRASNSLPRLMQLQMRLRPAEDSSGAAVGAITVSASEEHLAVPGAVGQLSGPRKTSNSDQQQPPPQPHESVSNKKTAMRRRSQTFQNLRSSPMRMSAPAPSPMLAAFAAPAASGSAGAANASADDSDSELTPELRTLKSNKGRGALTVAEMRLLALAAAEPLPKGARLPNPSECPELANMASVLVRAGCNLLETNSTVARRFAEGSARDGIFQAVSYLRILARAARVPPAV